jgi:hypothetical protein
MTTVTIRLNARWARIFKAGAKARGLTVVVWLKELAHRDYYGTVSVDRYGPKPRRLLFHAGNFGSLQQDEHLEREFATAATK